MKSVFYYDTPIGRLGLAENGRAVTDVLLHGEHPADAEEGRESLEMTGTLP